MTPSPRPNVCVTHALSFSSPPPSPELLFFPRRPTLVIFFPAFFFSNLLPLTFFRLLQFSERVPRLSVSLFSNLFCASCNACHDFFRLFPPEMHPPIFQGFDPLRPGHPPPPPGGVFCCIVPLVILMRCPPLPLLCSKIFKLASAVIFFFPCLSSCQFCSHCVALGNRPKSWSLPLFRIYDYILARLPLGVTALVF